MLVKNGQLHQSLVPDFPHSRHHHFGKRLLIFREGVFVGAGFLFGEVDSVDDDLLPDAEVVAVRELEQLALGLKREEGVEVFFEQIEGLIGVEGQAKPLYRVVGIDDEFAAEVG